MSADGAPLEPASTISGEDEVLLTSRPTPLGGGLSSGHKVTSHLVEQVLVQVKQLLPEHPAPQKPQVCC